MQMRIFWRLTLGYLVILFMSVVASAYSIGQLSGLSDTARAALSTDNRMIAYGEKLTDAFLSEVRYAGRFIITHSGSLQDQFRQFKNDFIHYLAEINSLAASPEIKVRLSRIEELHLRYQDLFDQEIRYINARQPYAESRYQQEKEKILESALREMERLKANLQKNLQDKLETMEKAARTAGTIATLTTVMLLGLGVALSFLISKSITTPLVELRRKMAQQSGENYPTAAVFASIPEIRELADTLNQARRKVDESAKANAAWVRTISEQFATPLVSLKTRLAYLNQELAATVTPQQKTTLETLAVETEHLIQRCAQLEPALQERIEAEEPRESPVSGAVENRVVARENVHETSFWSAFPTRLKPTVRSFSVRWYGLVSWFWNIIFHSIKTLDTEGRGSNEKHSS